MIRFVLQREFIYFQDLLLIRWHTAKPRMIEKHVSDKFQHSPSPAFCFLQSCHASHASLIHASIHERVYVVPLLSFHQVTNSNSNLRSCKFQNNCLLFSFCFLYHTPTLHSGTKRGSRRANGQPFCVLQEISARRGHSTVFYTHLSCCRDAILHLVVVNPSYLFGAAHTHQCKHCKTATSRGLKVDRRASEKTVDILRLLFHTH